MAQLQPAIYLADRPAEELKKKPADDLKQRFVELVMCDFTPRHPSELPASRWVSFDRLYQLFQPHAARCVRGGLATSGSGSSNGSRGRPRLHRPRSPRVVLCKRVTKWQRQNIPLCQTHVLPYNIN